MDILARGKKGKEIPDASPNTTSKNKKCRSHQYSDGRPEGEAWGQARRAGSDRQDMGEEVFRGRAGHEKGHAGEQRGLGGRQAASGGVSF